MTAVQWLVEQLAKNGMLYSSDIAKAKEMEKHEIEQAYFDGTCFEQNGFSNNPSQYYKVNYTKDKL